MQKYDGILSIKIIGKRGLLGEKNQEGLSPYHAVAFIKDRNPLTPWKVINYMEEIIKELFDLNVKLEFTEATSYEDTKKSYIEEVKYIRFIKNSVPGRN